EDRGVDVPLVVAEIRLPPAGERVEMDDLGLFDPLAPALPREHRTPEPRLPGGRPRLPDPTVAVHQQSSRYLGQPEVQERERAYLVPEDVPEVGFAVRPAGRHPGVEVGGMPRAHLEKLCDVQPEQQLKLPVSGQAQVARPPQFTPRRAVALEG